jgi:pimeloyl-ACP methyl ester carboxylesterase
MSLGVQEVVLIGHSYGGVKIVYYQAQRQDPHVVGLVLASPGPINLARFREPEQLEQAHQFVARGPLRTAPATNRRAAAAERPNVSGPHGSGHRRVRR